MTNSEITTNWINNFKAYCAPRILVLKEALTLAVNGRIEEGKQLLTEKIPFVPHGKGVMRYYSGWPKLKFQNILKKDNKDTLLPIDREHIFQRDKYQCRYSGVKLLSLEAIEVLKVMYFEEFPFPNYHGNQLITHIDAWTFYPQVDHLIPLKSTLNPEINLPKNLATTSNAFNFVYKSSIPFENLGVNLVSLSDLDQSWDGLNGLSRQLVLNQNALFQKRKVEAKKFYEERLAYAKSLG